MNGFCLDLERRFGEALETPFRFYNSASEDLSLLFIICMALSHERYPNLICLILSTVTEKDLCTERRGPLEDAGSGL